MNEVTGHLWTVRSVDALTVSPVELGRALGSLDLEDVCFGFSDEQPVLTSVDLEIEPGQMVAVVGARGSGKTTLVDLLCRRRDPQRGRVRLDGHDVRDLSSASLVRNIAHVPQQAAVLPGVVRGRQRLAMIRALMRDAPVVVLDEPTDAIDPSAERMVLDNLRRLLSGRTVVFTTRRPPALELADRVVMLIDGILYEHGDPAALANDKVALRTFLDEG